MIPKYEYPEYQQLDRRDPIVQDSPLRKRGNVELQRWPFYVHEQNVYVQHANPDYTQISTFEIVLQPLEFPPKVEYLHLQPPNQFPFLQEQFVVTTPGKCFPISFHDVALVFVIDLVLNQIDLPQ